MKPKLKYYYILVTTIILVACLQLSCSKTQKTIPLEKSYPIIPTPQELIYGKEEITFKTAFVDAKEFYNEASHLKAFLAEKGITNNENGLKIQLIKIEDQANHNKEAYQLKIDSVVTITAKTMKGAFYGVQTLKQVFRSKNDIGVFPQLAISDYPSFEIRGLMHDTGRNFQSVELLKEQLDIMALYKYNVFHWHLTDNPGWRLESKKYPELQSEEATTRRKGKFYTQEDFKEILAYCKERHITVIPELDIPGHTEALRKALGVKTMNNPKIKQVLLDLFAELIALADENNMPYIHIGTDEVKAGIEQVSDDVILDIMNLVKESNREVVVWKAGITINEDSTSIHQLWAQHPPSKGHRFIDSRSNYINHLDPFAGMARLFFQQPCRQAKGDSIALGGILCSWPDNNISQERDMLKQNPIYPAMVFYADAIWKGRNKDYKDHWAKLPHPSTPEFSAFKTFEDKVIVHRNLFFQEKEFPYIKQSETNWKVIGPFDHKGNMHKSFPIEDVLKEEYTIDGKSYQWQDSIVGATVHFRHFFGFPSLTEEKNGTYYSYTEIYSPDDRTQDFWIGFHGWSRAGGRRGGPTPNIGQWHNTTPKIWVNGNTIEPPVWKQPNLAVKTDEIPFVDEDYFYREPTEINLKKGWNKVLLKIPHGGTSWKWMFTCTPIKVVGKHVEEQNDLIFKSSNEFK